MAPSNRMTNRGNTWRIGGLLEVISGGFLNFFGVTGITAFATGGQASATALTGQYNRVGTCATAGDSVKLPTPALGRPVTVKNDGAASLDVFPATGGTINGLAANAAVKIPPGAERTFWGISTTAWHCAQGVAPAAGMTASPRLCHTGGVPAQISTEGTDTAVVVTELYVAEVFIPCDMLITGVAVMWGSATNGNAKVALFDSAGNRVALSASTDVSGYTADSYGSRIAFATPYAAKGPATYYVGVICDDNTNKINTHILGNFGAGKIETLVYATEAGYATITPPTTFTTGLGPIATLY